MALFSGLRCKYNQALNGTQKSRNNQALHLAKMINKVYNNGFPYCFYIKWDF